MGKAVTVIKENFTRYKSICFSKKEVTQDPVKFDKDKPSRPDTLYHLSPLVHKVYPVDVALIAEQRKLNNCSYKFQIRCKDFYEKPLFRFDSDGLTHQNKDLPLAQQQITTPHFNAFDENGKPYAYKTQELEIIDYSELKDITKFFSLFCEECYIVNDKDAQPGIIGGDVRLLGFDLHNEDLLSDVNFEI